MNKTHTFVEYVPLISGTPLIITLKPGGKEPTQREIDEMAREKQNRYLWLRYGKAVPTNIRDYWLKDKL